MLFQLQVEGAVDFSGFPPICEKEKWTSQEGNSSFASQEPTSVLHMRRSPSPPTSASTLSSSFNGGAHPDNTTKRKDEWAADLQPIPGGLEHVSGAGSGQRCSTGLEDWEAMLSKPAGLSTQDNSVFRWISGDVDESSFGMIQLLQGGNVGFSQGLDFESNAGLRIVDQAPRFDPGNSVVYSAGDIPGIGTNLGAFHGSGDDSGKTSPTIPASTAPMSIPQKIQNPIFCPPANNLALPAFNQARFEGKPQILNPQLFMNQQQHQQLQNPNFFMPLPQEQHHLLQPLPKRHDSGSLPFFDPGQQQQQQLMGFAQGHQFLPQQKPMVAALCWGVFVSQKKCRLGRGCRGGGGCRSG